MKEYPWTRKRTLSRFRHKGWVKLTDDYLLEVSGHVDGHAQKAKLFLCPFGTSRVRRRTWSAAFDMDPGYKLSDARIRALGLVRDWALMDTDKWPDGVPFPIQLANAADAAVEWLKEARGDYEKETVRHQETSQTNSTANQTKIPNKVPSLGFTESLYGSFSSDGMPYMKLCGASMISGPAFAEFGENAVGAYAVRSVPEDSIPIGPVYLAIWKDMASFESTGEPIAILDMSDIAEPSET